MNDQHSAVPRMQQDGDLVSLPDAFKQFEAALWRWEPPIPDGYQRSSLSRSYHEEERLRCVAEWKKHRHTHTCRDFSRYLVRGDITAFRQTSASDIERVEKAHWRRKFHKGHEDREAHVENIVQKDAFVCASGDISRICEAAISRKLRVLNESHWPLDHVQIWRSFRSIAAIHFYRREPSSIGVNSPFPPGLRETDMEIEEAGRRSMLRATGLRDGHRIDLGANYWLDHVCPFNFRVDADGGEEECTQGPRPVTGLVFLVADVLQLWPPTDLSILAAIASASRATHKAAKPSAKKRPALKREEFKKILWRDYPNVTSLTKQMMNDISPQVGGASNSTMKQAFAEWLTESKKAGRP